MTSTTNDNRDADAAFVEALDRKSIWNPQSTELDREEESYESVLLAAIMRESIEQLRHWVRHRAVHATHADKPANGKRKVDLS